MSKKCAIIFGANGISGVAMTKALLASNEWGPIICVSRRPPQLDEAVNHKDIKFVSIDMVQSSADALASKLSEAGAAVAQHTFFYTYIEKQDPKEMNDVNKMLLEKALHALGLVSPKLKSFMLQTGTKYYGNAVGGDEMVQNYPWKEDAPRLCKSCFYYDQEDLLQTYAVSKNWRWLITRPGVILGVSKGNAMNFAVTIALYASLQKELKKDFVWPGNEVEYNAIFDHASADNNSRFQIYLSVNDKVPSGAFNIKDKDQTTYAELWPKIAQYFGLRVPDPQFKDEKAKHPKPNSMYCQFPLVKYAEENKATWHEIAKKYDLDPSAYDYATWGFVDAVTGRTWPDYASMEKAKQYGWTEERDTVQSYYDIFDELKKMKVIPK
ncbi:NAD(P)-binding protein [Umbelopsis sp. PMI_123]|nr:NAD(P)-binding protein [Umbelopsis sp. PMI_123]